MVVLVAGSCAVLKKFLVGESFNKPSYVVQKEKRL